MDPQQRDALVQALSSVMATPSAQEFFNHPVDAVAGRARTLVCGPAGKKERDDGGMAEKSRLSVERRGGHAPSRRAERSDFTLSQLNRAVIRLPPHAQEPLDDRVDVETRASHLR